MSGNSASNFLTASSPSAGLSDIFTLLCPVAGKNITEDLFSSSSSCRTANDYVKNNWLTSVVK